MRSFCVWNQIWCLFITFLHAFTFKIITHRLNITNLYLVKFLSEFIPLKDMSVHLPLIFTGFVYGNSCESNISVYHILAKMVAHVNL